MYQVRGRQGRKWKRRSQIVKRGFANDGPSLNSATEEIWEIVLKRGKREKNKIFSPVRVLLPPVMERDQGY